MGKFSVKEFMNAAVPTSESIDSAMSMTTETGGHSIDSTRSIQQITAEVNFYKAQAVQNIIEIGKRLTEAKTQLPHGEWSVWLKNGVDFSERSAQRFMQIAEAYPNPSPVSDLSCTKLLTLLQLPAEDREDFLAQSHTVSGEEKTVQDMSKRELERVIRELDGEKRKRKDAESQVKKEYNNYMNALVKAEKEKESNDTLRGQVQMMGSEIRRLESRPVDVAVQELSEDDKEKLRQEGAQRVHSELAPKLAETTEKLIQSQSEKSFLQEQLQTTKEPIPADIYLAPEATEDAADAFADTIDAAYSALEVIVKLSNPQTVISCISTSMEFLRGIVGKLGKLDAHAHNRLLLYQDVDLPEDDHM